MGVIHGIMEKKMETTIMGCMGLGFRVYGLNSLKGGYIGDYTGDILGYWKRIWKLLFGV